MAALEAALLDAAWEELVDKGYDHFTIQSVAERARTSRAFAYVAGRARPNCCTPLPHGHG